MSKTAELPIEVARKMYQSTDQSIREFALANYPEIGKNVMERIKTFEDACREFGDHGTCRFDQLSNPVNLSSHEIAFMKLITIVEALNEGWQPNWDDENERKYYPWFNMSSSGVGFSYCDCFYGLAGSTVGSRLVFKSEELAKYAANQFLEIYKQLFTI